MKNRKVIVGVIGGNKATENNLKLAYDTGKEIAKAGFTLVCGGMGGVMEAACNGAKSENGLTIGILPGNSKNEGNPFIDIPIVTAMSHARNAILVRTADHIIAIDGEYGTLSEIALAKCINKKVYGINTWDIDGIIKTKTPHEAIKIIKQEMP